MTKLPSSYNFPWLSNFNYNSVSLQLLSLYFFFSLKLSAHKVFSTTKSFKPTRILKFNTCCQHISNVFH
ncbi:hypothetical protein CMV_024534 [Castanea mollissima]|uniref:Uncharacterized protein n=1 Tax=Castanea mollissima TaxID=60419 RepID=A0A8J4VHV2_9ROSI|nr:hypothetical protein CMV_024534 [Castanea mollissima]